jgi:hypothetical protein
MKRLWLKYNYMPLSSLASHRNDLNVKKKVEGGFFLSSNYKSLFLMMKRERFLFARLT